MEKKYFGTVEGETITEYTLSNKSGMRVSVINWRGTITKIITPDRDHQTGNLVLGFDSFDGYLQEKNPFFGSLIGPYANRIAGSVFTLDDRKYKLVPNDRGNTLHGGPRGFHKTVWTIAPIRQFPGWVSYSIDPRCPVWPPCRALPRSAGLPGQS